MKRADLVTANVAFTLFLASFALAAEPVTLETVAAPASNLLDEPIADEFSVERAASFLDSASLSWQKTRKCMTCHTNYAYLYSRPAIAGAAPAHQTVRAFAENLVTQRWEEKGPRWDAEVVATAAALAFNDAATTRKLHATTRVALDRMWTVQQENGGWSWLKCGWPPMESDDHYGVTLAAIAAGVAPESYIDTPAAQQGLTKIRTYLKNHPPPTLHHQAMLLWASSNVEGLMTNSEKEAAKDKLIALQHTDGGWGLATLGDWDRADGTPQDLTSSDGYGTGFVVYVLRLAGVPAESPEIQRGVAWLKSNQRESGRWFTRSLNKDSKHYISHAGTAMAILALSACDELNSPQ